MTARQQIARVLPLVLLVVLVIAGLRGVVPAPRWNGPLKADGIAIGIALEVIFCALLLVVLRRDSAARRVAASMPYNPRAPEQDIEPPRALRFTLKYVLTVCVLGIGAVLLTDLHLHFFDRSGTLPPSLTPKLKPRVQPTQHAGGGGSLHIPWGPILYALLITAIVAAVVVSIWWSTRLRRPAAPLVIEDVSTEELRAAVAEGRAALAGIDDARAAIIACYVAMERRLAERGTARGAADTPDELLARAVASGAVRGGAAGRLTALFYEARFSTHPLGAGQRDAASAALDELAVELAAKPDAAAEPAAAAAGQPGEAGTAGESARPGGGWV
ncbi:MAG: DUF4129 domain-containing protein [Trebonia sp.]